MGRIPKGALRRSYAARRFDISRITYKRDIGREKGSFDGKKLRQTYLAAARPVLIAVLTLGRGKGDNDAPTESGSNGKFSDRLRLDECYTIAI